MNPNTNSGREFSAEAWLKTRQQYLEKNMVVKKISDYTPEEQAKWAACTGHVDIDKQWTTAPQQRAGMERTLRGKK